MSWRSVVGIVGVAAGLLAAGFLLFESPGEGPEGPSLENEARPMAAPAAAPTLKSAGLRVRSTASKPKDAKARAPAFKGPTRTIPFTVTADDSTPLEGVPLRVESHTDGTRWAISASTTDALGAGEVRVPVSGPARWHCELAGYGQKWGQITEGQVRLDVRLARGGSIQGTVRGPRGEPAAGITVHLKGVPGAGEAITDAAGRYGFPLVSADYQAWVWATSEGLVPAGPDFGVKRRIERGKTHVLDFILVKALTTQGRVVTHDGVPVSGARVWVAMTSRFDVPKSYWSLLTTETTADGTFRIAGLPRSVSASSLEVHASAPGLPEGHAGLSDTVLEWDQKPRRPEDPVEIVLGEPCFLWVKVVDEATGEGIPNVRFRRGVNSREVVVETGPNGRCRIGPLAPGKTAFVAHAKGWSVPWDRRAVAVEAVPGSEPETTHAMYRVFDIKGRVIYAGGEPANDRAYGLAVKSGDYAMSTDTLDTFHIRDVPAGMYTVVISSHGMEGASVDATDGSVLGRADFKAGTMDAVIVLKGKRPVDLEVVVRDPSGALLETADLIVRSEDREWNMHNTGEPVPLSEGRARITGVVHPVWMEIVPRAGSGSAFARVRVGPIKPGTPELAVTLEAGRTIAGSVVDERGQPVPNANVRLFPEQTEHEERLFDSYYDHGSLHTGEDGRFVFERLWQGDYWVWVDTPDAYAPVESVKVSAGRQGIVVRLHQRADFQLPVFDSAGAPLAGAKVSVWTPPWFGDGGAIKAVTNAAGVAHLNGVDPEGVHCLEVKAPRGVERSRSLWLEEWRPSAEPVRLPVAWRLAGIVLDAAGRPASGASVRLIPGKGRPVSEVLSESDGSFRFVQLPLRPVHLSVRSRDGRSSSALIPVASLATDVEIPLREQSGSLRLQLLDWPPFRKPTNDPWLPNSMRFVVWDPASPGRRRVGVPTPEGLVAVEGLDPSAAWSVLVTRNDRDLCLRLDDVVANGEARRVRARPCRPIRGRVSTPEDIWPLQGTVVESGQTLKFKDDGSYEIKGLPLGRWTIRVEAGYRRLKRYRTVVVTGERAPLIDFGAR